MSPTCSVLKRISTIENISFILYVYYCHLNHLFCQILVGTPSHSHRIEKFVLFKYSSSLFFICLLFLYCAFHATCNLYSYQSDVFPGPTPFIVYTRAYIYTKLFALYLRPPPLPLPLFFFRRVFFFGKGTAETSPLAALRISDRILRSSLLFISCSARRPRSSVS